MPDSQQQVFGKPEVATGERRAVKTCFKKTYYMLGNKMTGTYQTNQTVDWQRPSASHVPDSKFRTALNRSSSMRCLLCKPGLRLNSVTTSVNRCSTVMSGRWRPSFSYCSSTQENRNASCKLLGAWRSLPRNDKVIFRNER